MPPQLLQAILKYSDVPNWQSLTQQLMQQASQQAPQQATQQATQQAPQQEQPIQQGR